MPASLVPPPIDEVVVTFRFAEEKDIDPVLMGAYLNVHPSDWGGHEIRDPILDTEEPDGGFSLTKLRTWFISKDEATVLQVQSDRVAINWRRRNEAPYPGFTKHVLPTALARFRHFDDFINNVLGHRLKVYVVELVKIDLVVEGLHYANDQELASVLPVLAPTLSRIGLNAQIGMRWAEPYPDGSIFVTLSPVKMRKPPESRAIRIESRLLTKRSEAPFEEQFAVASEALNAVFGKICVLDMIKG
jgi:hypothetical protein